MLLFSAEKTEFPFFEIPFIRVLPVSWNESPILTEADAVCGQARSQDNEFSDEVMNHRRCKIKWLLLQGLCVWCKTPWCPINWTFFVNPRAIRTKLQKCFPFSQCKKTCTDHNCSIFTAENIFERENHAECRCRIAHMGLKHSKLQQFRVRLFPNMFQTEAQISTVLFCLQEYYASQRVTLCGN